LPATNPKIQVECSAELLTELHEAHEALLRAQARARKAPSAFHLERLIVALHAARNRAAARPVPPHADAAG
jgi:hypothetical protein